MYKKILLAIFMVFASCTSTKQNSVSSICEAGYSPVKYQNLIICTSNDYYMMNGIRTPVDLPTAYNIARANDAVLPNKSMVDAIYAQADIRLAPITMPPTAAMTSRNYYVRHNGMIEEQLSGVNTINKLIAGHKKDIVSISENSSRVAIYGWHRSVGNPIQPYSTVHGRNYYDYSHGLRLIKRIAYDLNGNRVSLGE